MTPEQYERIREVFLAARWKDDRQRAEFLDTACRDDALVRAEVESLLANDQQADTFLRKPALGQSFAVGNPESLASDRHATESDAPSTVSGGGAATSAAHPERVGRYRILDLLGEGGMGVVYRARQDKPRRTVALKVIKPGIESREVLRRFEDEGQVLAWLQHPGIAQIYEAGTADTGRGPQPFFAMELVQGKPLIEYARANWIGVRQRLELIAKVCDAVHHAHQKGVIHRDLKPGNILVDASGQPKVLDFGVARVTDADIQTTTLQTAVGQLVGTLAYMSPEQIAGDPRQLDTRSDVYALGVILYELLTGRVPLDVSEKTLPQAARAIEEEEPASLSSVNRVFRGDVETIVAKALEKDKSRRYQSASDLAEDIRRYLSDQPISARPVTTVYQLRKFARRNKALVGVLAIAFVALTWGLIHVTLERNRAVAAERLAEQRREEAETQRAEAEAEAGKAQAISNFMQQMLASVGPDQTLGRDVPFRAFLDLTAERIETDLSDQSEVQATVHNTLGRTYRSLGLLAEAESHLRLALATRQPLLGEEHLLTMASLNELAITLQEQGKLSEAEPLYRRVLEAQRRSLGAEHPNTITMMNNLGGVYLSQGKLQDAEALIRESLALRRRVSGEDHLETLRTTIQLVRVLQELGRLDEAEPLSRQALEACQRVLGDKHPLALFAMRARVWLLTQLGALDEAGLLGRQCVKLDRQVLGEEHPSTFYSMTNLAVILANLGQLDEAESLDREVLAGRRRVLGDEHPDTVASLNNLAARLYARGKVEEAEPLYQHVLAARRRLLGDEHPDTLSATNNLALSLSDQGKLQEAEPLWEQVLAARRRILGEDHPSTLVAMNNVAANYLVQGRYDEAEPLLTKTLETRRRALDEDDPRTLNSMRNLGMLYEKQGRYDEAEPLYVKTLQGRRRVLGQDHPDTLTSMANLGSLYARQGRYDEGEPLLAEAVEARRRVLGEDHPHTLLSMHSLAGLYKDQGRYQEAEPLYRRVFEERQRTLGEKDYQTLLALAELAASLIAVERFEEAEPLAIECYGRNRDVFGPAHTETSQAVERLVQLYEGWSKPDQAAEWRTSLSATQRAAGEGQPFPDDE